MSEIEDRIATASANSGKIMDREWIEAILQAMRQPSDAMMGAAALTFSIEKWQAEAIWKCMVDEALK